MGSWVSRLERLLPGVLALTLAWGGTTIGSARARAGEGEEPVPDFTREVAPLLATRCLKCHGGAEPKGGLDLRTRQAMLKGGDSGPALTPGSADESLLFDLASRGEMPPKREGRLSAGQIALIKDWINAGAPAPDGAVVSSQAPATPGKERGRGHWAFRELARPSVPTAPDRGGARTPVDAFLLAKLAAAGRTFSPEADRSTLVRRLYFDLIGLPLMPEEVDAFVEDRRPDAYERWVDRLLASPHFGERWGRHWLDGAGFSDIVGCDNDAARIKLGEDNWRYRDYVVRSINADKPFDRFLAEQLAGDELVDWRSAPAFDESTRELLIATGFLRTSADDTDENELNTPDIRHGVLQRTGEVLAGNLLGLTLNCAKCHDHKYEPISQRDYYQFLALLQPAFNPESWLQPAQRRLADVSPAEKAEWERRNAEIDRQVGELGRGLEELRRPYEDRLAAARLAALPEPIRADVREAIRTAPEKRSEVLKYLAGKFEATLKVRPDEVASALDETDRAAVFEIEQRIAALKGNRRAWGHLQAVYDVGPPTPTRLLRRGNHLTPGPEVRAGFLGVLCASDEASALGPTTAEGATSGRRLALARWLNDGGTPAGALVLRVRVNRIWQHLFGSGIVETSDNFGVTGAEPTHPELLEWLAGEFDAGGRRLKPLIRLLVTSAVYRQASARPADPSGAGPHDGDPENRLLGRMRLRRLESEAIRDRILAVSGKLDRTFGGLPIPVEPLSDGTFIVPEKGLPTPTSAWRRSLYLLARRNYHPDLLGAFDQPDLATNCTRRATSAVVLQSLAMLNDRFVVDQAGFLAGRVAESAGGPAPGPRVRTSFAITLGRPPTDAESSWCLAQLGRHEGYFRGQGLPPDRAGHESLVHLCHTLLNTSEFLYIP